MLQVAIQRTPSISKIHDSKEPIEEDIGSEASHELKKSTYYVLDHDHETEKGEGESEGEIGLKVLARIPTCAVFHKLTAGRGVPHSFVSEY